MSQEPSWDHYRSFRAVLAEGSLSGAARALALTQPTVARHLDQLEAALGRRLFVRTPRGLSPTEAVAAAGAALRAGFGIGVCQVGLAAGLTRVLPEAFSLALPIWVVMHEDLRTSPRCRAVFDALAAGLAEQIA